jgi:uncharacterized protein with PQ loop repeat
MFTQFLGTVATAYGVLGALKTLLQTRQMLARRSSRDVSAGFLASYVGGYAIWLAYGVSTGSIPLIVVDTAGLLCGGLTLAVALSLRGPLIRAADAERPSGPLVESLAERQVRGPGWLIVRSAAGSAKSAQPSVTR